MLDFEGLRAVAMMSAGTGRETLSSAMACEPTTDLDDQGAAGDRLGAPADGGRGMDSLASGADLSAVSRPDHRIGVPYSVAYTPLFDSNAKRYDGFAAEPPARVVRAEEVHWHDREFSVRLTLPALSAVILKPAPHVAFLLQPRENTPGLQLK